MGNWDDFVEISQTVFTPLESEFGFRRQTPKQPFIDYDSPNLKVSPFYDVTRGAELDLRIRRIVDVGTQKPSMGISSLMAIYDPASWETYRSPFVSDRPSLERFLLEMKQHLFKYGTSLLGGDLRDFDTFDRIENEVAKELRKQRRRLLEHSETSGVEFSQAPLNPNGIPSLSPGLRGTSYPGSSSPKTHNPERVASPFRRDQIQPLQG